MTTGELTTSAPAARPQPRSGTAYIALIAGVSCISFTAIFTKWAGVPGPVAAAIRMAVAAAVLTIPLVLHLRRRGLPRAGMRWGVTGGLWFALNLGLLSSALLLTSAANATLMDNTAPIWVGLGALVFFREKLTGRYWARPGAGAGRRGGGVRHPSEHRLALQRGGRAGLRRRGVLRRVSAEHAARPAAIWTP